MTQMEYAAQIQIEASPERVWNVLVDTKRYPEWDPHCERIEGELALGAKLKAFTKLSPGRAFPVRVTELEPQRRMVWTGGMPLGLFTGERTFTLTSDGPHRTHFTLREVFSGPLLRLIGSSIPDMTEPFRDFAEGLRARAEDRSQSASRRPGASP